MSAVAVPAKCPLCGRLTADNRPHCHIKPNGSPTLRWATHCGVIVCPCGCHYANHGHTHYQRDGAA